MQREQELFHQRLSLDYAYKAKVHDIKARNGATKEMVYPNQVEAATEIVHEFFGNDKVVVTLIALPQVGKTGTFLEVAYRACTHPDDKHIIDPRNVFIITGMSDSDWQKQTVNDMLEVFKRRVYHRGKLNTKSREDGFYTNLSNARNALIILDECHIAAEKTHMISGTLAALGLLDINTLRDKNIKILEVSATPGATLRDTQSWGTANHSIVTLKESPQYIGFKDFIREDRLHPSFDLMTDAGVSSLALFVKMRFPSPRWHIIRLPAKSRGNSVFENKFRPICEREGWSIHNHSASSRIDDLDYHMETQPKAHCFLLIKEFWRAGKRLIDKYVGIVHEPTTKIVDTNVTAQGLVGRLCGNDKKRGAGAPHMFCNMELIHEYLEWINARGDFNAVKQYRSRNLTIRRGEITSSKDTWAHPSNMKGIDLPVGPAAPPVFKLSPAFITRREAHAWADCIINWSHVDLNGLGQLRTWDVGTAAADGKSSGTTHYKGGDPLPIRTEEVERNNSDYGRFGGGVRCAPVRVNDHLEYVVMYKTAWETATNQIVSGGASSSP